MKILAVLGLLGPLTLAGSLTTAPALADEALPAAIARHLDERPAEFTASEAKMRRMMIIQQNMNRQNGHGTRGYGHGYGARPAYGPGPRPGYGPGPRPGYGHQGGYDRYRRY